MRRTIAKALVLFILFANLAWAADMDEIGILHDPAEVQASIGLSDGPSDDGDSGHDGLKHGPCDHCCHGSAHYVGIPPETSFRFADNTACVHAPRLIAYYVRDKEPPVPPPNI